jgi:type II secretory pathway component PulF
MDAEGNEADRMPVYRYNALDIDASVVAGTLVADTPRAARDSLRERGLTVTGIAGVAPSPAGGLWRRRRAGRAETVAFVRELATLLAAGIPLLGALDTLLRQHRGRFHAALQGVRDRVAAGAGLAEAMGEHPAWFDDLATSIVRVGESTGTLETALARLAQFQEKAERLRSRVTTALLYPAVVCAIGLAVTVFLMTYVVPQLLETLTESGRPLPAPTWIVKGASDFLLGWWWALLAGAVLVVGAAHLALRTERGRLAADRLTLALPLVGDLAARENTSRMAVVLAALLRSGLVFDQAVRITRATLRNRVFRRALETYEQAVIAGRDVAGPLEASGVFPPMVVQMLAVGQQSGQLEAMLDQLAETYDHQVATATQRLTALLEPLLIVVLAVVVGFIAFATILPIMEASHVL